MRRGLLKWAWILAICLMVPIVALWVLAPLLAYSLLAAAMAPVLSGVAFLANIVVPIEERSFRIEALVTVDGRPYRAAGIATCRRLYQSYGAEKISFARRLRIFDGYVSLVLPDGRQVQSSAFLVCSEDEFAKVKDRIAFYLVDRRAAPIRAQQTSVSRSLANPAAPFRVEIASAGPTREAARGRTSHRPEYLFATPPVFADVKNELTSYVALPIPKEVWSGDETLRAQYSAITEFRAVPKPPDDVLRRLVAQTDAWPASGTLAPDHSRVDLPTFGPALPITFVAIQTHAPADYNGPPFKFPVPQACLGEKCIPMPMSPYGLENVHGREGFLFDPSSQTLIAIRANFAGIYDAGKAVFMPR